MSYTESKIFITPVRDSGNSYPQEIEFTSDSEGRICISVDHDRELTFTLADFKRIVAITEIVASDSTGQSS